MNKQKVERFDMKAHRALKNYNSSVVWRRLVWSVLVQPLLRTLIPRHLYSVRNAVFRLFGAKIGEGVRIYSTVEVFYPWNLQIDDSVTIGWGVRLYTLAKVHIGEGSLISQGVHICAGTHDYSKASRPLVLEPISIGKRCWIAADAFVGPGIQVGDDSIVGARSVVVKRVDPLAVVAGNPARPIRDLKIE
ncbi:MAG: DapH/DapD/GlmU-related protein [Verrucomicrobiota bacterium]